MNIFIVLRLFEEKRRDTVFGFPWCVVRGSEFLVGPCPLNSSHSFCPILLKLYRCFKDGLKICMCVFFFQNPEIIFYHFLHILNLDIF